MKTLIRCKLSLAALGCLAPSAVCRDLGDQQVITTATDGGTSGYATDLDGYGDADVLPASTSATQFWTQTKTTTNVWLK